MSKTPTHNHDTELCVCGHIDRSHLDRHAHCFHTHFGKWDCDCKTFRPADVPTIRELLCQRCDLEYPVWFAPNELWNAVQREGEHFFCPTCFITLANERLGDKIWKVCPDVPEVKENHDRDAARELAWKELERKEEERSNLFGQWKTFQLGFDAGIAFAESQSAERIRKLVGENARLQSELERVKRDD